MDVVKTKEDFETYLIGIGAKPATDIIGVGTPYERQSGCCLPICDGCYGTDPFNPLSEKHKFYSMYEYEKIEYKHVPKECIRCSGSSDYGKIKTCITYQYDSYIISYCTFYDQHRIKIWQWGNFDTLETSSIEEAINKINEIIYLVELAKTEKILYLNLLDIYNVVLGNHRLLEMKIKHNKRLKLI